MRTEEEITECEERLSRILWVIRDREIEVATGESGNQQLQDQIVREIGAENLMRYSHQIENLEGKLSILRWVQGFAENADT